MAALEKLDREGGEGGGDGEEADEEKELLIDGGVTVLDFDMLCSTVALQAQGKWSKLDLGDEEEGGRGGNGGILRMWEGDILDCFENRRLCLESACCPCYRFGKNMRRAGYGSCFIQGAVYLILIISALLNLIAFTVTGRHCFLYLAIAFIISVGMYMGFFRMQIKQKFNIRGSDNFMDDCVHHLVCPCCTLCQESRTLEMNNVQDGIWHGRGDTICVGSYMEGNRALFELHPPPPVSIQSPDACGMH